MKRREISNLVVIAVLAFGAGDATAQDEERRRGARGGIDVESIMSMQERLELSDDQMTELDAWRSERVAQRNEARAGMDEMRSRLRAGQIERSEMMAYLEERRDALQGARETSRTRLEGILDENQLGTYDGLVRERRAFARGRASAMRNGRSGVRGGRGGVRSGRSGIRDGGAGMRRGRPGLRGGQGWRNDGRALRRGPRGGEEFESESSAMLAPDPSEVPESN